MGWVTQVKLLFWPSRKTTTNSAPAPEAVASGTCCRRTAASPPMMKHRRPAKSKRRIVDEESRGEFFVKRQVKSMPLKFKRRHQRWPAIAIILLLISGLFYTRHIATKRASELSAFPPNWWDVQKQASLLLRCPQPQHSPMWNCYNDLVDENSDTVHRANRLFDYAPNDNRSKEEHRFEDRIPHLLIFTHKYNLFDCSVSASNSTSPNLHTLAENAKATVNAYSRIWSDLRFVYLSDDDCLDALNRTEPGLIPFFNDVKLEGALKHRLSILAEDKYSSKSQSPSCRNVQS